ncbi:MAG TPA: response regulator [Methanoregulaceae archaeon]|nr:response regulator [Methanoregulaceae archaeon]
MYRIMIVDDNPAITEILGRMIRKEGYDTIEATSGAQALVLLTTETPDLILLDILMEPMNGWETLRQIKNNERTKDIPVMMITAKSLAPDELQQYSALFEDYIQKPIPRRELYDLIAQFFRKMSTLDEDVAMAREKGADEDKLTDFRELSREIEVRQRLIRLLKKVYVLPGDDNRKKAEIRSVIEDMASGLSMLEDRLIEIKREL